jgi:MFS family permease
MVAVFATLLCFGRVSDTFGRFKVIVASVLMLMLGLGLSMVAQGVATLILARAIIGFGNGILATTAALAMGEAHPQQDRRKAAVVTSSAITVSFGAGPVIGGVIAQWNVYPLVLPYVFILALAVLTLFLIIVSRHQLQGPAGTRAALSIVPKMALPVVGNRLPFLLGCAGGFFTFGVGGLFASLVPSVLPELNLPWQGPIVVGVAFIFMAVASTLVQTTQTQLPPFKGLMFGMGAFGLSVVFLAAGMYTHSITVLIIAMICFGIGQGFGFMYASMIASLYANEHRRAANMSTFFLSAYTGATVPTIGVGVLADYVGLSTAIYAFCFITTAVLSCLSAYSAWMHRHHRIPT